ncbi:MAG: glutaredoxin [Thermoplasmata archaeon]|nr:MAG: glutaredoxin [Thermoplasmata archaeon]RLF74113.1 MAG: glutaredoxin [Thermoplasmata archaeon]HDD59323.1 glutaredoxin [Euryarchaeota archaeon]
MINISDEDRRAIEEDLKKHMKGGIHILYYGGGGECPYCEDTLEIVKLLASLTDKIHVDIIEDEEHPLYKKYTPKYAPAIILLEEDMTDTGIRFYGIPAGYEFESLMDAVINVSKGVDDVPEELEERIKRLKKKYILSVFITPTCPYCPISVKIAHRLAYINRNITGEMIEAIEFPELAQKFEVMGVPKTVIFHDGDHQSFVGAYPIEEVVNFLEAIERGPD